MDQPSKRPVMGHEIWPAISTMLGIQDRKYIQSLTLHIDDGFVKVDIREVLHLDGLPVPTVQSYKLMPLDADERQLLDTTSLGSGELRTCEKAV